MGMESFDKPKEVRMPDYDTLPPMPDFDTKKKEDVLAFAAERRDSAEKLLSYTHDKDGKELPWATLQGHREIATSMIKEAEYREKQAGEMGS